MFQFMRKSILLKGAGVVKATDEPPLEQGSLLIRDGRIVAVGPERAIHPDPETEIIDLTGKWIIPGLIDAHVHIQMNPLDPNANNRVVPAGDPFPLAIRSVGYMKEYLKAGVTYIRDAGGPYLVNVAVRQCVRDGIIEGPGMITCGRTITITGGHAKQWGLIADGIDEVRKAARSLIASGVDVLKVTASGRMDNDYRLSKEEIATVVSVAKSANKQTMAHTGDVKGIKDCVSAGIRTIEHASELDDEVIEAMLERKTFIVPTLTAYYFNSKYESELGHQKVADHLLDFLEMESKSLEKAYKAGVPVAVGTDAGTIWNFHGKSTAVEIQLLIRAGMSPVDALIAATRTGAQVLGVDRECGTLEVGKRADLVVLNENPLVKTKTLLSPFRVYQNGKEVSSI